MQNLEEKQMVTRVFCCQQDADRITIYRMDAHTGALAVEGQYELPDGPAPLAVDPQGRWLVVGLRRRPGLATLRLDTARGLGEVISAIELPVDPCYVSTDRAGRYALTAYYGAGRCAVHRIGEDGALAQEAVQWIETAPHAHCIRTDPSNRYAYLPHTVPANQILQFAFDAASGRLTPLPQPKAPVQPEAGPRHYCYHPSLDRVYVSNEDSSTVSSYALDAGTGQLELMQTLSTLPEGFTGKNSCAQIHMSPNGRWLFVSNRGHDSLAVFGVAGDTGLITAAGHRPTEPTPRVFGMEPSGRFLYTAGLGSDRLAAYALDDATGQLDEIATYALGRNPMWVLALAMGGAE
jgi:6-phosphogluconolactonase